MYIDPVVIWAFAVSAIIYYLFIPGISFVAGVFLFGITLLFTFIYDTRKKALNVLEQRSDRLRRSIRDQMMRIDSQNSRLERINRKIRQIGLFKQMSETISGKLDETQICEHIVSYADQIINKDGVIRIFLLESNMQNLCLRSQRIKGDGFSGNLGNDGINRFVLQHNRSVRIIDRSSDRRISPDDKSSLHKGASIAAPLITADRALGVIRMDSIETNAFALSEQWLLSDIANVAALLISNARLYNLTRQLAVTDGLTGLATHNACKHTIQALIGEHRYFTVFFIDVDDFKPINDTFGHIIGDQALIHISQILSAKAPCGTFLSRYGGEEFVLVLQDVSLQSAGSVANYLREAIEESVFSVRRQRVVLTVSIGCASYEGQPAGYEDIIRAADFALYRAKQQGKNRVVLSGG
jgi:diguanylate cyclase (GGDEF)-like protein